MTNPNPFPMTPLELAEAIEDLFERQPEESELLTWLENLQERLIGHEALVSMQDARQAAIAAQQSVESRARLMTPSEITEVTLASLASHLEVAPLRPIDGRPSRRAH